MVRQVHRPVRLVQVAQRGAAPRRHPQPCAGQDRVRRLRDADARERRRSLGKLRRHPGAGRLRQARRRGQDHRGAVRPREQDPLPRHLPGHAGRDDRVRAPQGRPGQRQQHRVRPAHAAPGDRADRRVAGRRRHRSRSATRKSDLGGTMRLGAQSSDVEPGTLAAQIYGNVVTERHRHRYEANEHYLDRLHGGRPGDLRAHAAREADRDRRAAAGRAPVVHRRAVPPRVQVDAVGRPSAVHQLHQGRAGAPRRRRRDAEGARPDGPAASRSIDAVL